MRRLPIYFLIDISESMVGEPIEQVQEGIATIIKELKTDPYALETVWVSIIGFAGKSKIITPLQDIITFYPPKIPVGSGTSLSKGLSELMASFDRDIVKTTFEKKGDWKPVVFLSRTEFLPTIRILKFSVGIITTAANAIWLRFLLVIIPTTIF